MENETKRNIYQRINAVMQEVDYIQKLDKKVNNQYRFVSHDQVTATLHGPLTKHGIVCIPTISEMKQEGNRTEVKLLVNFINIDDPQDLVSVIYYGYGIDQSDKGIGKAVSYAFKYALLKTFCLETGDDPDQDATTKYEAPKQAMEELPLEDCQVYIDSWGDQKDLFIQYMEHTKKNQKWSTEQACAVFKKSGTITQKSFNSWLAKQQKKEAK